ncbi:hypothetical protein AB0H30_16180 [Streptomyces pseudogriseolus]|uniref:hypothetical protein n=1 Tax=Streptomyces pseudogriseolus TaxID=36817 RepID=UPI00348BFD58
MTLREIPYGAGRRNQFHIRVPAVFEHVGGHAERHGEVGFGLRRHRLDDAGLVLDEHQVHDPAERLRHDRQVRLPDSAGHVVVLRKPEPIDPLVFRAHTVLLLV